MRDSLSSPAVRVLALCAALLAPQVGLAQRAEPPEFRLTVTRFAVEGPNPLSESETGALLAPFLGEQAGLAGLEAAAEALERAMRERGHAFHRVIVPAQTPGAGVVTLQVLRFTLGAVSVTGNRHFSRDNILASLPGLTPGETPDSARLGRSLAILNEHPAKRAQLVMREGALADSVDAEVRVQDNDPRQWFAALDNTGREETGRYRASINYQNANLFDRDHALTLSYTTSPDHPSDVAQYGLNYSAPLYALGGSVALFAVRSDVDSGTVADFFQVSGRGEFWGARYTQAFPKRDNYGHKLTAGVEGKLFVNNVDFLGAPVGTDVGSMPLSLRYSGSALERWGSWGFHAEYAANLGGGPRNSEADYAASRAGASANWRVLRYGADLSYRMDNQWTIAARLRGQQAGEPLIAGEQFGVGGAASVRGFLERETAGDSGHQLNAELWTPPIGENLRPFGFADYGYRKFDAAVPGQNSTESLASVGAGLRWRWQQFDLAADLAGVTNGVAGGTSSGRFRMHFSLLYRF